MTWCIYALGGGWGHLMRAIALARLAARDHPVTIITNCRYLPILQEVSAWIDEVRELSPNLQFVPIAWQAQVHEVQREIPEIIHALAPEVFLVDTFPRGIVGELVRTLPTMKQCRRILIHRDIDPNYLTAYNVENFVRKHYNLVISVEKHTPLHHLGTTTSPWLIRDVDELEQSSNELGFVVCVSGKPEEQVLFEKIALSLSKSGEKVTLLSAIKLQVEHPRIYWTLHFPGIEIINKASLVIGSGGYHTVHECKALGKHLISIPMTRAYDRQRKRCRNNGIREYEIGLGNGEGIIDGMVREAIRIVETDEVLERARLCSGVKEALAIINR